MAAGRRPDEVRRAPLHPDDRLDLGMQLFAENDLPVLPVVDGTPQNRVIGLVRRSDLSKAYLRKLHGEMEPARPIPDLQPQADGDGTTSPVE